MLLPLYITDAGPEASIMEADVSQEEQQFQQLCSKRELI